MATENTVMAAVLAPGETVLGNAACEPHVQDLCRFLVSLGAQIDGIESNVLRIHGVERLGGGAWSIGPDHIEVGSFIGMAAITGGDLTIEGVDPQDLVSILPAFERLGVASRSATTRCTCRRDQQLVIRDDLGGHDPEDRGRPVAGVPVRPHVDRDHRRDAGVRHGAHVREDVREPPVLHRQARVDGRADHPLRSAPRRRHRADAARRAADGEPGHPRRHGDAARGALRRGPLDDRRRRTRSTRATSASTSACARSARPSSASTRKPEVLRTSGF